MHMALLALGIGPGDEVITTPMTFIATATAILEAGAKPVFVDVEPETGNIDAARVEAAITPRTQAILPVHLYGLLCDMRRPARRSPTVTDWRSSRTRRTASKACATASGRASCSDAACFSFYATKNLTCGEGGALVTDDAELLEKLTTAAAARHDQDGRRPPSRRLPALGHEDAGLEVQHGQHPGRHAAAPAASGSTRKLDDRERLAQRYGERLEWPQLAAIAGVAATTRCTPGICFPSGSMPSLRDR